MLKSPASQIYLVVQSPASFGRVTCLPPKNASAPWGGPGSQWLTIIARQVSYIQYLLACQNSQRSTPHNIVKSALPWSRIFRRRHLGRQVTAVTCLRWPTMMLKTCRFMRLQKCPVAIVYHFGPRTGLQVAHLICTWIICLCQLD